VLAPLLDFFLLKRLPPSLYRLSLPKIGLAKTCLRNPSPTNSQGR